MDARHWGACLALSLAILAGGCGTAALPRASTVVPATPTPGPAMHGEGTDALPHAALTAAPQCEVGPQADDAEPSVEETRRALEHALSAPSLPGIETLLLDTVVVSTSFSNETMEREAAAGWLRERAGSRLQAKQVQRHHHVPVLIAVTEGWSPASTVSTTCVTFSFHRYGPSGEPDDDAGAWLIDVINDLHLSQLTR